MLAQASTSNLAFRRWIDGFRARARQAGIRDSVFDEAFRGVRYNTDVIQKDRNQSEFTKQIWEYLDSAASETRVKNGREAFRENKRLLAAIEARYGVEAEVVTAIWGLESAYGSFRGDRPLIEALATLAFDGRRGRFFEQQLIAALRIIQAGDISPRRMTGSWAGAMGHTQFIPTSYLGYAVDFNGDGKRDIWSDDPTDALASTASYLNRSGWTHGQPWGVEVVLPRGFNYSLTGERIKKSPADWAAIGVRDTRGQQVPNHGRASIRPPGGPDRRGGAPEVRLAARRQEPPFHGEAGDAAPPDRQGLRHPGCGRDHRAEHDPGDPTVPGLSRNSAGRLCQLRDPAAAEVGLAALLPSNHRSRREESRRDADD